MIWTLVLVLIAIGAILAYRKINNHKLSDVLPGRTPVQALFKMSTLRRDLVQAANQQAKWFRWAIIGQEALIACHPDTIKYVLSNPDLFEKKKLPSLSKEQDALFDGHMLSANGATWHRHRSATSAAFHWDAVKGFADPFYSKTMELMKLWAAEGSKPVEVTDILPKYTLDVLGVSVFGYDFQAIYGKENDHFNDYYLIINFIFKPFNMFRGILAKLFGLPVIGDLNDACVRMREFCKQIIIDKQNQLKNEAKDAKTFDIVDMMIHSDAGLTLDEMVSNVFIFFVAGHETTASALSWMLYHLGTHQDVQQKVREEVDRVLNGGKFTSESMRELHYTSLVIKENMRLQPPVAVLSTRECVQDTEVDGVFIPKGVRVGIGFEAAHKNEQFWAKPNEFNPDRFENSAKQHPFAYLPFSLKSRACIGSQFSIIEQTTFLATLVQHFKWTFVDIKPATKSVVLNRPDQLRIKFEQIKPF